MLIHAFTFTNHKSIETDPHFWTSELYPVRNYAVSSLDYDCITTLLYCGNSSWRGFVPKKFKNYLDFLKIGEKFHDSVAKIWKKKHSNFDRDLHFCLVKSTLTCSESVVPRTFSARQLYWPAIDSSKFEMSKYPFPSQTLLFPWVTIFTASRYHVMSGFGFPLAVQ